MLENMLTVCDFCFSKDTKSQSRATAVEEQTNPTRAKSHTSQERVRKVRKKIARVLEVVTSMTNHTEVVAEKKARRALVEVEVIKLLRMTRKEARVCS
jgi:ribosome-binding protein aMBF1 (putative translation factor)